MEDRTPRSLKQESAHRRGLVLGLTMAEIMVLTLFILLLIIAVAMERHRKEVARHVATIAEQGQRIAELANYETLIKESPNGVQVKDIVQQLRREKDNVARLESEVQRLTPYETNEKSLDTIIAAIIRDSKDKPTEQEIIERINRAADLIKESENLKGQVAQLSTQIKKSGRGNEFPSCWVTPDGKPESIFDLLINENGIRIAERDPPYQVPDKSELPLDGVVYDTDLMQHEFEQALRPLYFWSVAHQCRFYVIIASSESHAPIRLVNSVNGYFYPDSKIQFRPARS